MDSAPTKVNIVQGEYYMSGDPNLVITTLLGSCIAVCLYDPVEQIGGMNHFLLPGEAEAVRHEGSHRYGVHLMELLINSMLKAGASRNRLQAKLFGGGKMVASLADIGAANARFAKDFLELEGIRIVNASTGGVLGRRLKFWPASGRASQMYMQSGEKVATMANTRVKQAPESSAGELELF